MGLMEEKTESLEEIQQVMEHCKGQIVSTQISISNP